MPLAMKQKFGFSALLGGCVIGALMAFVTPSQALAQSTPATTVKPIMGVIDLQAILGRSHAARGVASQRETYLNGYQAKVAEKEKELRAIDQALAAERATLDPQAFAQKREEFQRKVAEFQKEVEAQRRSLERAYTQAMNEIQASVIQITQDIANRRGMNIIVYRSQVFLFDPSIDITDPVLEALNKALPAVTMPDPASLPPRESR